MPGMDGFEVAELMRGKRKTKHIPIIFVTAISKEQKYVFKGYEVGAVDYMPKPLDPDILKSKVNVFIELDRQRKLLEKHTLDLENEIYRRIQAEEALQMVNQHLDKASKHKSEFLASMSHELRTPLNAIIGYISLTLNEHAESLSPEPLENLIHAEQAARSVLQIINDILDFSKIEAGKIETFIEEFDLKEVIEDCTLTARGQLTAKSVELRSEVPSDLPFVESDYTKVKQILNNLISNSIKFTNKGYVAIRLMAKNGGSSVYVEVEDTGCGIPEEKLDTVFESYKQADASIEKRVGGTGLGLNISKEFCDILGIEIGIQSKVDQGTTIWLEIPARFPKTGDTEKKSESPEHISAVEETARKSSLKQTKAQARMTKEAKTSHTVPASSPNSDLDIKAAVLCLSGQNAFSILCNRLNSLPLEVLLVKTVPECLEKVTSQAVCAIVVELNEDNSDVLTQLKCNHILRYVPVLICWADTDKEDLQLSIVECDSEPVEKERYFEIARKRLQKAGQVLPGEKVFSTSELAIQINLVVQSMQSGKADSILLVDDNEINLHLVGSIFKETGYKVYSANSGQEGIDLAKEKKPDIVLMDLEMPKMDGFEATRILKQDPATSSITFIALTGMATKEAKEESFNAGCEGYLTMPIEPKNLIKHVKEIVFSSKIKRGIRGKDLSNR